MTGPAEQVLPLLAALALAGHAYDVDVDTDDESVMDRIYRAAAGGISYLKHDEFADPPLT